MSSHLVFINRRNKISTAKLLHKGYRYHKLRKAFFVLSSILRIDLSLNTIRHYDGADLKAVHKSVWAGSFHVCFSVYRSSTGGFLLLQYSSGDVWQLSKCLITLFLLGPHLCFIIGFICDLFVARNDL